MKTTVYTFARKDRRGIAVEVFTSPETLKQRTTISGWLKKPYSVDSHEIDAPACCARTINRKLLKCLSALTVKVAGSRLLKAELEAAEAAMTEATAFPVPSAHELQLIK